MSVPQAPCATTTSATLALSGEQSRYDNACDVRAPTATLTSTDLVQSVWYQHIAPPDRRHTSQSTPAVFCQPTAPSSGQHWGAPAPLPPVGGQQWQLPDTLTPTPAPRASPFPPQCGRGDGAVDQPAFPPPSSGRTPPPSFKAVLPTPLLMTPGQPGHSSRISQPTRPERTVSRKKTTPFPPYLP